MQSKITRKDLLLIFALIAAVIAVYSNTLNASWHLDDVRITKFTELHLHTLNWKGIKTAIYSDADHPDRLTRPVTNLSLALTYYFAGLNIRWYHIGNILIHCFATIFLYLFIYNTLKVVCRKRHNQDNLQLIAWGATLLWAINPVQIQAVTYIIQRATSLAGMFYIIGMYCYLKARLSKGRYRQTTFFLLSLAAAILAFGAKKNAVMLPVALLLYELFVLQENFLKTPAARKRTAAGLVCLLVAAVLVAYFSLDFSWIVQGYKDRPFTLQQRLLTEPRIIIFYLSLLFYPVPTRLCIEHHITLSTSLVSPLTTLLSIMLILFILFACLRYWRRWPFLAYCVIFFFLNQIVESTFIPLELIFEHRNYIPSMLLFVPVAYGAAELITRYKNEKTMRTILTGSVCLYIIGIGSAAFIRNLAWRNEYTLNLDAVQKNPHLCRPRQNLSSYYIDQKMYKQAEAELLTALKCPTANMNNEQYVTYHNLGVVYFALGRYADAERSYLESLRLEKNNSAALAGLASVYYREGKRRQADLFFKLAQEAGSLTPSLYLNRGLFYLKAGELRQAIASFAKVRAKNLEQRAILYIGIAYMRQKQYGRALEAFKNAMRMDPMDIRVRLHLAALLLKTNQQDAAENVLREAVAAMITDHFYTKIEAWLHSDTDAALKPDASVLVPIMEKMRRKMTRNKTSTPKR